MSTSRRALASLVCVLATLAAGCAARTPRVAIGAIPTDLSELLSTYVLEPGQGVRADRIARTDGASHHLVQVLDGETPHRHRAHDLSVLVLRGEGTLRIGASRIHLRAGDAAVVPRGEPHWFTNEADTPTVALAIFTPPLDAPDSEPVTE